MNEHVKDYADRFDGHVNDHADGIANREPNGRAKQLLVNGSKM